MAKTSVVIVQSVFMFFILCLALLGGAIPTLFPWFKKNRILMCLANSFSGGVFLAMAVMHILPEVSEKYDEWKGEDEHEEGEDDHDEEHDHSFSLPFFLVFVGYALILLIDKVLFDTHSLMHENGSSHGDRKATKKPTLDNVYVNGDNAPNKVEDEDSHKDSINNRFVAKMSDALKNEEDSKENSEVGKADNISVKKTEKDIEAESMEKLEGKQDEKPKDLSRNLLSLTPIALMLGLCTHAVFEGIVVGLEDELSELWSYIIAISLHKFAASMSLGISMVRNFKDQLFLMCILMGIFSLATPIGIGIGMAVNDESDLTEIIFTSLTAGTFIYIACSEVIAEEFKDPKHKYVKMGVFLLGAAIIACINLIQD